MRRRFTSNRKTSSAGYCAITATQDNTNISCDNFVNIYYAINDISNWYRGSNYIIATLNTGDTIYLKASYISGISINCDKPVELSGSILSLVYGDNNSNETSLSSITRSIATFKNVVSVSSDFLPSKDLGISCYANMFSGCTGLIKAPKLPATTLAASCYESMFRDCTSLQTAPELPATTLADYCYYYMFHGCSNLNYIKMLATDISAYNCLFYWVNGVASTGTFVKASNMTSLPIGEDGIPSGWTVLDSTFPTNEEGYPESTEFSFPLYLNCTNYDGEDDVAIYYSRPSDEISMALYEYLASLNIEANEDYTLTTDEKIFCNRIPISVVSYMGVVFEGQYENIVFTVFDNGQIYMDYYK